MSGRDRFVLYAACVASLGSLALMAWSQIVPRPIPVIAAMSLGQVIGTLSLAAFAYVAIRNYRR